MPGVLALTPEWLALLSAWCLSLAAAGRSCSTIRLRRLQLERLARWTGKDDPRQVSTADLEAWLGSSGWSRDTLRSHRAAVRAFYAWLVSAGHLERSPAAPLPAIRPAQPRPRPTPDAIYADALARARGWERLALRLGAEAGLRRAEIAAVHLADLEPDLTGWSLRVRGKGDRVRRVPLSDSLARAVLEACRAGGGPAFPGQVDGHVSPGYLGKRVSALLPVGWSTHSLRHRFATRAYGVDRDVFTVQQLLGHASPETTRRYVALPDNRLRATVEAIAA